MDQSSSPVALLKAEIDVSIGKFGAAEIIVSPASPRKLDEVRLLVSYWKDDVPIGGHCARITTESLYKTGVARVPLSNHVRAANRVLFSVASATSGDRIWKKATNGQGTQLLKSALYSPGGRLTDADWLPNDNFGAAGSTQGGCTLTLADCTTAAVSTCGEGKVGGVTVNLSECVCCFYCKGESPANCGGDH